MDHLNSSLKETKPNTITVIPNVTAEELRQRLMISKKPKPSESTSKIGKEAMETLSSADDLLSKKWSKKREEVPMKAGSPIRKLTKDPAPNLFACDELTFKVLQSAKAGSAIKSESVNLKADNISANKDVNKADHQMKTLSYQTNQNSSALPINTTKSMLAHTSTGVHQTFLQSLNFTEKQHFDLMNVPNTFFYLKAKRSLASVPVSKASHTKYSASGSQKAGAKVDSQSSSNESESVYDLELITQHQVDKRLYFTLSKEGVTMFRDKVSSFTSLAQWEREYVLFHKIANINFFKRYRRWKAFAVWKNSIRSKKRQNASESLQAKLFLFNPPLYRTLANIRGLCLELVKESSMISLVPGRIFELDEFISYQQTIHDKLRKSLNKLSATVLQTVRAACDEVVDNFLKSNNIIANHKMTFMERAALRSECKSLTRFLRMVDITMNDFLLSMVVDAVEIFSNAIYTDHDSSITPRIETSLSLSTADLALQRTQEELTPPVFLVYVNFKRQSSTVNVWDDVISIRPTLDQLVKRIDAVITGCIEVVSTFVKVFTSAETEMYAMPDGEDDEANGEIVGGEPADLASVIRANVSFTLIREQIFRHLRHSYNAVREYIHVFEPYRQLYFENEKYIAEIPLTFSYGTFESFQEAIATYRAMAVHFETVPRFADVGALFVDSDDMKAQLIPSPIKVLDALQDWLPKLALMRSKELLDEIGAMNPIISSEPSTVESYVVKKKIKDSATERMEEFKDRQSYVRSLINLLDDNSWPVNDNLKAIIRMLKDSIVQIDSNIQLAETKEEDEIKRFSAQVLEECPKLVKKITECREQLDAALVGDPSSPEDRVIKYLTNIESDFVKIKQRVEKIQDYQTILKLPVDEFEVMDEVSNDLSLKIRLWTDKAEWTKLRTTLLATQISNLDVQQLERDLTRYNRTVFLASKGLPTNKVVPLFKTSVNEINPVIPVVLDIRSTALQPNHMMKINELVGADIFVGKEIRDDYTLQSLIDEGVTEYQEDISVIATAALQESVLQDMMKNKVTNPWSNMKFEVKPYKDVKDLYILGDTADIVAVLDDSLVTLNTVLGSRYVAGIREYVDGWKNKLMHFQETLDEWLNCQRNWMYLETIFSSPDIVKQLPESAKIFQTIDKSWKLIMKQTNEDPNALKAATHDKSRKDLFKQHNANLDKIQKDLEDYLETKRMAFPRFYFLSNDELLEILSQAKDPRSVQPHLRKCFDNLVKLEFGNTEEGYGNDIIAMLSSENERVGLGRNLKARGAVEEWLMAVQIRMKEVLTQCMKVGLNDYDSRPREDWIFLHPGQVVATVAQMTWARNTESCLRHKDPVRRLVAWSTDYKAELQKVIAKIRGPLTKLMRCIAVALVTTDVHARDILDELVDRKVESIHDFLWQQQLRYYWESGSAAHEQSGDNCYIHHSDAKIAYGYEYMGATSRLVITPLTDRCWLTLTGSYNFKIFSSASGPAGTGKTESSKDLAKAMAIQCVVFNCSDQIDYKMMGKLFRGLAQSGAWVCLDEFNRIDIEVLSVIAQQLLVLRGGRLAGKSHVNFMGNIIPLVDHHVIITMNPGYAGRTELPDNLAVCFRPVSMMVPNYALIAEIMLFAEGFGDAKNLSQKMCKLYILCSEQLSQQPHYDYGLRAVKSVLVMAGALKRAHPTTSEDLVLIRALRDSNVPKFLADDLPLFAAIVQDLFPGVTIPSNDYGELQVALEEELTAAGLQKIPSFMTKVIQMFDIFNIRFGATLVGPSATGKTTVYRTLANVMTNLRTKKQSLNPEFQRVRLRILNPKCISMGELYGEFNPLTQEWHDGLASSIMREFVNEEDSDDRKWTVFDGPIDALWIESMNTVLDDNMTLCLANGERVKLKSEMKCLFEVHDLAEASPATVSRIGVVYLSPTDLGYMAYVQSWLEGAFTNTLSKLSVIGQALTTQIRERVFTLVELTLARGIALQRRACKEAIPTVDMQLAISFCTFLQTTLVEAFVSLSENDKNSIPLDIVMNTVEKVFFFSFVWSIGAATISSYWDIFSDFCRELFEEVCPTLGLPPSGNVFDYFIDFKKVAPTPLSPSANAAITVSSGQFREWSEVIPAFTYSDTVPYFSLLVPTADTCRFFHVMQTLLIADRPCFITGVTGTGKTVTVQNLLNSLNRTAIEETRDIQSPSNSQESAANVSQPSQEALSTNARTPNVLPIFMNFSAQTRSDVTQLTLESKLEKKRKNLLGAPAGRKVVVFVDDINMPQVETYGAQPPIELLRQYLDFKGFYDRDKFFWKDIADVLLFVGAAPPGGGRASLAPRFTRHFHLLNFPPASDNTLTHIFSSLLTGFLGNKFDAEVVKLKSGIVSATIEIYTKISEELLPTPSKFHYTFNLRDISKVFQGLLMVKPKKCPSADTFTRLWIHEVSRVFSDRLINSSDLEWFQNIILNLSSKYLKASYDANEIFTKPIIFTDYLKPEADVRLYEEVKDLNKLIQIQNDLLEQYNSENPSQMNLVFFQDALAHTTRISRILRQPRGNAMLIGVGGSGKQSLTRIAAYISKMDCISIEINRGYRINEFREDIKKLMIRTGVQGKNTVFLFTDSQIVDETMLEDLNNVLNTGEIPNLFMQDEIDKIISDMGPVLKAEGIPETRDNCFGQFVSRIRDKLHIVLCMSPVGDALRIRCRQFPSLINCTTIDWYHSWPESALVSVAERFLGDLELPSDEIRNAVVKMCGFVHRSIEEASVQFFNELRRRVYTTPKSYLDLINLYMSLLKSNQKVVETKSDRMKVGVRKLTETNAVVDSLKNDLMKLEPILKQKAIETESLLTQVARDTEEAAQVAKKVQEEEAIVSRQASETAEIAADAQRDLDKALPALESAVKALKSLTKADITEVRSFQNPPKAVQIVLEAVCTLLGEKESWDNAKKLLNQSNFTEMLMEFDKDNIPEKRLKKLRKDYINLEEMQPDVITRVSKAGTGLCLWVRAMDVYADVAKEVGPKKARLDQMNAELAIARMTLESKQVQLQEVMSRVAALQKKCDETLAEKDRLQKESDTTAMRLIRAEKLTNGLSSEGERWSQNIVILKEEMNTLIGDIFLSSASISYFGAFTGPYRDNLTNLWIAKANELSIPSSGENFSLARALGDPVQIREWHNQGLPTDQVSIQSGILVDNSRRWPLMIDPQNQANQWIRHLEEKNGLMITTMRDPNLLRIVETCIRNGKPLLLEDLSEQLEPALEPVLMKAVFHIGGRNLIRLGDSDVDYDNNFRLYMTTKLPNPHYLPEVCIKVTIINFTVTMKGLEAQLLGDVVKNERPDIEQRKVQLLLQMAEDKKQLQSLEAKILQMLSESEGNILDDQTLIDVLSESKTTSVSISQRVAESELTEKEINDARQRYLPVATRGSLIYFVIADLASIDPMYQYSLAYYATLFSRCIHEAEKSSQLEQRLKNIIDYASLTIFKNICRGLFEKDKLLFSASISFAILRNAGQIHDWEWNLFLRGAGPVDAYQPANPNPQLIPQLLWDLIYAAETRLRYINPNYVDADGNPVKSPSSRSLPMSPSGRPRSTKNGALDEERIHKFSHPNPFNGICESLARALGESPATSNDEVPVSRKMSQAVISSITMSKEDIAELKEKWTTWLNTNPSESSWLTAPLPKPFDNSLSLFQRLILIKALRENRLQTSIASFVSLSLGNEFSQASLTSSMEDIYTDLAPNTPCIFILSSGADPTGMLLRFARKMGYDDDRLHLVSLGQGQGEVARALIERGKRLGHWVVLQNCMLAKSWLPELDRIIFELQEAYTHQMNMSSADAQVNEGRDSSTNELEDSSQANKPAASTAHGVSAAECIHPDFRLYLTSAPAAYFPVAILQNGVKMTNEPPKGLRNNLLRSFNNLVKPEDYNSMGGESSHPKYTAVKLVQWKKLLTSLAFFHANIQERRKFGALGWNIRYAFDESDLETSIAVLKRFILEQDQLPWDALNYVTGQINYGGRVTDDWDRRCLMAILSKCLSPAALEDGYAFSSSGIYKPSQSKKGGDYAQVIEYFSNLPHADGPEVFGMHENVDVAFNKSESLGLMASLLSLQPRSATSGAASMSSDDIVIELAETFESSLPDILFDEDAGPTTFVIQSNGLLSSLAICLQQEMAKFNRLLTRVKGSLHELKQAIRGFIVMSADLDSMYSSFLNNQVPGIWEAVSFASLKSLASWYRDLIYRVAFMRSWLINGEPRAFPLPVFFFPQGFMTASLQTYARKHQAAIDTLSFRYNVLSKTVEEVQTAVPPEDGVVVYDLYLEGARFDTQANIVADSYPGKMFDLLPPIHFQPESNHQRAPGTYACPVYKTAVRKGVLSTTGMSTNFVVAIELPIAEDDGENKWILGGVAALCNLTD
jgi:dynein heavy chain, axonemal